MINILKFNKSMHSIRFDQISRCLLLFLKDYSLNCLVPLCYGCVTYFAGRWCGKLRLSDMLPADVASAAAISVAVIAVDAISAAAAALRCLPSLNLCQKYNMCCCCSCNLFDFHAKCQRKRI